MQGRVVVKTATKGMVLVPGGQFRMGSGDFYPEERPIHEVCRQHNQSSRISLRAPCLVFEAANAYKLQPFTSDP